MTTRSTIDRRREHFERQRTAILDALDRQQLEHRVRALASDGMNEHDVAGLVGLHIEQVRRLLAERREVAL